MVRSSKRLGVWAGPIIVAAAAAGAWADEDWRKLADLQPAVHGPIVKGAEAAALVGGPGRSGLFEGSGVTLLAWIPLNNFPGGADSGNDCWGYKSASGREYAIMGLSNGFGFVEVTDPANPVIVAKINGPDSLWHDVKVIGDYAYGVSEGGSGIQIMDLRNIDSGTVTLVRNWTTGGYRTTHNIAANPESRHLYLCGANVGNGGLVAVDVTDPENPVMRGAWSTQYVHDAQIVTYTEGPYAGREIAFCSASGPYYGVPTGLAIVDFTNKNNPQTLANIAYPGIEFGHQAWLSPDRHYLYLDDEIDDGDPATPANALTRIFDVSNPATPTLVDTFSTLAAGGWIDHNLYTKGNFIYEANYTGGLRVFDATNPVAPVEVAFLDTYPSNNSASFNGAWSNYPYFDNGAVIVSDMQRGLFIVRVDAAQPGSLEFAFPDGLPTMLAPEVETELVVAITEDKIALDPASVRLHYRLDGGAPVEVAMEPAGPDLFVGSFPALPCFARVEYWLSATADDGRTFQSPATGSLDPYDARVMTGSALVVNDTIEVDTGWTAGAPGDLATTGVWNRMDPQPTPAQPGDDHTPSPGVMCWATDGRAGGGIGDFDVDNGQTTLLSPILDLADADEAIIGYWRWYSNDQGAAPNADTFVVDVSNNGGASWTRVETVGPSGPGTSGGWIYHEFRLTDFVAPSDGIRLRFIASDLGEGSIVEAAIDDLTVTVLECATCAADFDGDGDLTPADFSAFRAAFLAGDDAADFDRDGDLAPQDFSAFRAAFLAGCG